MKILHVVNISFVIPFFLGEQLNYFSSKGYREYVVCSPSKELDLFSKRYSFYAYPYNILRRISPICDIKAVLYVYKLIKKERIDVVTGHTPKGALIAMTASYIAKVSKRIYFRHGLVYETSQGFKRFLLKAIDKLTAAMATKVVCVSPSVFMRSIQDGLNAEGKQVILKHGTCNGINTSIYDVTTISKSSLEATRLKYGITDENFVVGYTGRMVRDKGVWELVQAFQIIKNTVRGVKLLLVGMIEERDALPAECVDMIKGDRDIIMVGYVDHSEMPRLYAIMDVFVLPSYREGFPTSILEASSMKRAIITTRVTGCVDSIKENQTGMFVEHNPESLASAISLLYNDSSKRKEMGEKGRIFVVENFDHREVWEAIEELYQG